MSDITKWTLTKTVGALKNKSVSAAEIWDAYQAAIAAKNPLLNIYLSVSKANRDHPGLELAGVPLAIKDNVLVEGLPTTASSNVLRGFMPPYTATFMKKLLDAGAQVLGKTNLDAWAHGSSTETSDFGVTRNPLNPDYLPGGSSGGSAAAVAADLCPAAIGTETAGSIRQPSAWCGTVGLKPTYGRVSRYGVVAMGSSMDCPGPIAKTVEDAQLLYKIMAGMDPHDSTTSAGNPPRKSRFKIAFVSLDIGMEPAIIDRYQKTIDELRQLPIVESVDVLDLVGPEKALSTAQPLDPHLAIGLYTVLQRAEVSSNLARYDGIRYGHDRSYFGTEAKRRVLLGTYTLSAGYADRLFIHAQKVRTLFIRNYEQLFAKYDLVVSPSAPGYAMPLGAMGDNPHFGELMDLLLEPSSMAGLPGISVPSYIDPTTNLALGINIVAPHWDEDNMIALADAYERATPWNRWRKEAA